MNKIAIAGAGLCIAVGAIAGPVAAVSARPSAPAKGIAHGLKVKPVGTTNVKKNGYVALKVSKATPNGRYYCLIGIGVLGSKTKFAPNTSTVSGPTASAKGTFTCKVQYTGPFKAKTVGAGKKTVNCPPTKAQKKQHYACLISVADGITAGKKESAFYTFTPKK